VNLPVSTLNYTLKRQLLKLVGNNFRIYDPAGQLVAFVNQKGFRLKEDIRVYSDEGATQEVMVIQARQIMDFSAAYDIWDSTTQTKIGAMRRKGWNSIIRDEWEVLDPMDQVIGTLIEDSIALALVRRFLSALVPQNYDMIMFDGRKVVDLKQNFNPFSYHLNIDFTMDPQATLDRRMGLAGAILLAAIEGKQRG
jgi:uncharacterized protein YxjI